jgi:ferredoxin--NADP+ reductase
MPLGSKDRPVRVAIVGSGPSGFYAAESLFHRTGFLAEVDMFDRLPTPFGLVRGGVAPDHQKIKAVISVYEKVASTPGFRFFGNVKLGQDIQADELAKEYDAVVYAVGNESDRSLGIPGEELAGSHSATAFVGWYNGHPDWHDQEFDLSVESVAVIGIGNVAMDVTRVLARDPDELAPTDIADYALRALRKSRVRTIWLLGRRGPAQAAYSPSEIREIGELSSADLVVRPEEVVLDELSKKTLVEANDKKNVDYVAEHAKLGEGSKERKIRLRFLTSPVEILGEGGRMTALKIEKNALVADAKGNPSAKGTGQFETIQAGMILRSVGYRGIPIPEVPFDAKSGRIPNKDGRVLGADGAPLLGQYVVGWAKRGPTGLIGTNRPDSVATVDALVSDAASRNAAPAAPRERIVELLKGRNCRVVSFEDWKKLDKLEVSKGKSDGKIREKFTTVPEMLSALDGAGEKAAA